MMLGKMRLPLIATIIIALLSACGTYTPNIQEFWGSSDDLNDKLSTIVRQVKCELRTAFQNAILDDIDTSSDKFYGRQLDFFEKGWGVDVFLTFTIDEKSSFNPSISFTPPILDGVVRYPRGVLGKAAQSQSQLLGLQASSEANRVDKLHIFYTIADLVYGGRFPSRKELNATNCVTPSANGTLFLTSDLKFHEWFKAIVKLQVFKEGNLNQNNSFATQGVIAHNIKYQVVSTGNFTPSWKLVEFSANTASAPFLSSTRDRTQEIDITMGPLSAEGGLKQKALNTILASELRSSLNSVFRPGQ